MEGLFWGIILLLLLGAGFLSARLCCYRKQMRHMLRELQMLEQEETNLLLTCAVKIGQTQEVILAINRVLEKGRQRQECMIRENRAYRESITSISHDIRTPLTSARGYIQMLREGSDSADRDKRREKRADCGNAGQGSGASEGAAAGMTDNGCQVLPVVPVPRETFQENSQERRLAWARIVERRLNDLSGLLDQLFLYARIEAGEISLSMEELNAGNLFAETLSLFYEDFLEKGCEPEVFIEPKPCYIRADRQAFVRIVENLIRNALVHGTGDCKMSLRTQGKGVVLRIANAADDIGAEDMERIFDRFYTGDTSRSRRTTGLGLAIVRELARRMGGEASAGLEDGRFFVEVCFF